ncbi:MAG: type II toxin-antitoxin system PemK/MazF family toxin [Tatlockia sp.]|nr:type II toxin-antitoxin system PemK/MazF family toxin [Tatlockia sp.]
MAYIPEQGDIVWLDFASSGNEIMKRRPAFVISRKAFNEHTKLTIVAPITSRIRGIKLEVILPDVNKTVGAILVFQLKSVDFIQRKAEFIEKTSADVIKQVSSIAQLLVN